jgi:hypothetical protein
MRAVVRDQGSQAGRRVPATIEIRAEHAIRRWLSLGLVVTAAVTAKPDNLGAQVAPGGSPPDLVITVRVYNYAGGLRQSPPQRGGRSRPDFEHRRSGNVVVGLLAFPISVARDVQPSPTGLYWTTNAGNPGLAHTTSLHAGQRCLSRDSFRLHRRQHLSKRLLRAHRKLHPWSRRR